MSSDTNRVLEDPSAILTLIRRQVAFGLKVGVATKDGRQAFEILTSENNFMALMMVPKDVASLKLGSGEKVTLSMEDRTIKYECVVPFEGLCEIERVPCGRFALPRTLRRTDAHRFVHFVPDANVKCSLSNARGQLLDGTLTGLSSEGVELTLRDSRQDIHEVFRMGEEAMVDIPMEGNQKFTAPTRVAYFGDACVGLEFTSKADKFMLGEYRKWLDNQQQIQMARDREEFSTGVRSPRTSKPAELAGARIAVDRDPMILLLSEKEDLAKRLAEALGRKFGFAHLNYIKGPLLPQLKELGAQDGGWGRVRLILVHHQLMVASPLELTKQVVEQEKCPLPLLVCGTEEDAELKANRAVAHGAVDYLSLDPFRILTVMKKLDDTLKLFGG